MYEFSKDPSLYSQQITELLAHVGTDAAVERPNSIEPPPTLTPVETDYLTAPDTRGRQTTEPSPSHTNEPLVDRSVETQGGHPAPAKATTEEPKTPPTATGNDLDKNPPPPPPAETPSASDGNDGPEPQTSTEVAEQSGGRDVETEDVEAARDGLFSELRSAFEGADTAIVLPAPDVPELNDAAAAAKAAFELRRASFTNDPDANRMIERYMDRWTNEARHRAPEPAGQDSHDHREQSVEPIADSPDPTDTPGGSGPADTPPPHDNPPPSGPGDAPDDRTPLEHMIGTERASETMAERHPEWPPVLLIDYFSGHDTDREFYPTDRNIPSLSDLISYNSDTRRRADIYLFEEAGGNYGTAPLLQEIANTQYTPRALEREIQTLEVNGRSIVGTAYEAMVRAVAGTQVIVGSFDVRLHERHIALNFTDAYDRIVSDVARAIQHPEQAQRLLGNVSYDDKIRQIAEYATRAGEANDPRDRIMMGPRPINRTDLVGAGRFEEVLGQIFEAHPELLQREAVTVVSTIGSGHDLQYHRALAAGVNAERIYPARPYVKSYLEQTIQTGVRGRDLTAPEYRQLLVRTLMSEILDATLRRNGFTSADLDLMPGTMYIRTLAESFTEQEVRSLYETVRLGPEVPLHITGSPAYDRSETGMTSFIDRILASKGMPPLAKNAAQINGFNQSRAAAYKQKTERLQADTDRRDAARTQGDPPSDAPES